MAILLINLIRTPFLFHTYFVTFHTPFLARSGTIASSLYGGADWADERHRHRYEVNPALVEELEQRGLQFSGRDESRERMEVRGRRW